MDRINEHHWRLVRYLFSGTTAALVLLGVLHFLVSTLGIQYLFASGLAFTIAFCVSFILQKFFTFKDHKIERIHTQAGLYLIVFVCNIICNTALMYFMVDKFGIPYLVAQVLTGGIIALWSYFLYRYFIFKPSQELA